MLHKRLPRATRHASRRMVALGLTALALLHSLGWWQLPSLLRLEARLYDLRLVLNMPHSLDERIVIVDVDERSLAELGRWPWPRHQLAALVDELVQRQQVASLGLDMVLAEPEHGDGPDPLAQAIAGRPVVLGHYFTSDQHGHRSGQLPPPLPDLAPWPGLLEWNGYGASTAELAQAARAAGFFNAVSDLDGLLRSSPTLIAFDGGLYESMALAMLRLADTHQRLRLERAAPGSAQAQAVELIGPDRRLRIPMDRSGTTRIGYRGPGGPSGGSFRYVSASDVLAQRLPAASLQGRYVLLGFSSPGLMDLRATPAGVAYPGVEIHANLMSAALDGRTIARPAWAADADVLLLLLVGLLLVLVQPRLGPLQALAFSASLLSALVLLNFWLFLGPGLELPLANLLFLVVVSAVANAALGFLLENRVRRRLTRQFASYVPPELVRRMLETPEQYNMLARTQELTVMFCDLRGFTSLAESSSPKELQELLADVLGRLSQIVHTHHGTIDKYIGDCIMAFWGAPVTDPEHARHAVDAALAIRTELRHINQRRQAAGQTPLAIGIGLNTGHMLVGNMGSPLRRTYTVIGDAVNLAARLENLTAAYGTDLLVTQATREHCGDAAYLWQEIDQVRVRGRQGHTRLHTVRGRTPELNPALQAELALWQQALDRWRAGDLQAYADCLERLAAESTCPALYQRLAQRLAEHPRRPDNGPDRRA